MKTETIPLHIPGLSRPYIFYHTSDCHIAHAEPWEGEQAAQKAQKTVDAWSYAGLTPKDALDMALQTADADQPDGLFLCGDAADYLSQGTLGELRRRLARSQTQLFYVPGNHERYGVEEPGRGFYSAYDGLITGDPAFWTRDFGEFVIVGMDDGDKQMQPEQLDKLQQQFDIGKPILLLIHIPILTQAILPPVKAKWGENGPDYFLLGQETGTECSRRFCQMLADPVAPIAAVFAGHIHIATSGDIIPGRPMFTSAPTFEGVLRKYILTA